MTYRAGTSPISFIEMSSQGDVSDIYTKSSEADLNINIGPDEYE